MRASAHRELLLLQKRIFKQLRAQADQLLGEDPEPIRRYEAEFRRDFSGTPARMVAHRELLRAIRQSQVTFLADFHTYSQAQRTVIRLLRETVRPKENWRIGLEMIASDQQPELDRFQAGKLSLPEFLEAVRFDENWGFPWDNYAPIFAWAREQKIPLVALNRPGQLHPRNRDDLYERDRWAAGIITDLFAPSQTQKNLHVLALYGELHVASAHLPSELEQVSRSFLGHALNTITIHQNDDRLYWKLAREEKSLDASVVRLNKRTYCIFSGTPWAKLQSLVSWADGEEEFGGDFLSAMQIYANVIAEFLGSNPVSCEGLSVLTIAEANFVRRLERDHRISQRDAKLASINVTLNRPIYLPSSQTAYLGSPSQNRAAEMAALHLLKSHRGEKFALAPGKDGFYSLILDVAFGFFGSLVINPKRKTDLPEDHLERIKTREGNLHAPAADLIARQLALRVLHKPEKDLGITPLSRVGALTSRYIGEILGKKLHRAVMLGTLTQSQIAQWFLTPRLSTRGQYRSAFLDLEDELQDTQVEASKRHVF